MASQKGFFERLFDFSFSEFIAVRIVGVLYALGIILAGLMALGIVLAGFGQGFGAGIVALIVAPIAFLLYCILIRIGLEAFIAAIRTAENTRLLVERMRNTDM